MNETRAEPELRKTGEPAYRILQHSGAFDIRMYEPYLVAEVTVPGPAEAAGGTAFRLLSGYIFGGNSGAQQLAMTAPVTQTPVMLDMTAPATHEHAGEHYVVHFVMPPGYTLQTLPTPNDARVTLREVPAQKVAVLKYSGRWTDENFAGHLTELRESLRAASLVSHGHPILSRYNGPYVLPFLRRNEVWLAIE